MFYFYGCINWAATVSWADPLCCDAGFWRQRSFSARHRGLPLCTTSGTLSFVTVLALQHPVGSWFLQQRCASLWNCKQREKACKLVWGRAMCCCGVWPISPAGVSLLFAHPAAPPLCWGQSSLQGKVLYLGRVIFHQGQFSDVWHWGKQGAINHSAAGHSLQKLPAFLPPRALGSSWAHANLSQRLALSDLSRWKQKSLQSAFSPACLSHQTLRK